MYYFIAFSLGIIASQYPPFLIHFDLWLVSGLTVASCTLIFTLRRFTVIPLAIVFLAAFIYGQISSGSVMGHRIDENLEGQVLTLTFDVRGLPLDKGLYTQVNAHVVSGEPQLINRRILINVYATSAIKACDRVTAEVKLKRPHGIANMGGFDYEAYLFEKAVVAKGYIKQVNAVSTAQGRFCLDRWRDQFRVALDQTLPEQERWIKALAIADKSGFSQEDMTLLRATGIGHLFVISGLHIGLVASASFFLVMLLRRLGLGLLWQVDWRPLAYSCAIAVALFYALFAGLSLPAQRALIMLVVFFAGNIVGVQSSVWTRYFFALALLLLLKPQSILNTGFVLSFTALFYILLLQPLFTSSGRQGFWGSLKSAFLWQLLLSLVLLPVMYFYFSGWPFLSVIANLLAIPVVTFIVIPLVLLGLIFWLMGLGITWPLWLSGEILGYLIDALAGLLQSLPGWYLQFAISPVQWFLLLFASVLVLLKPRKFCAVAASFLLIVALFLPAMQGLKHGEVLLDVIDVGQGLSILIQTENHVWLYDLGAKWATGSMVSMAVMPVLNSRLVRRLDYLVISHNDNDHKGDIALLLQHYPDAEVITSEDIDGITSDTCQQGDTYQVDGFQFVFVNPQEIRANNRNDNSCVLLISGFGQQILVAGDISAKQERKIAHLLPGEIDVLIAPHHGSKYSSSSELVTKANAGIVVFSAGFKNRFKHPHPSVLSRYQAVGSTLYSTATGGQVSIQLNEAGKFSVDNYRLSHKRFWREYRHF